MMLARTLLCIACWTSSAIAGETLYNGIVLPDEWPPHIATLTREPMPVPYLDQRPDVAPIDVGRQLFVDDFLIESTTLTRRHHAATWHPACPILRPDRPWECPPGEKPCAMVFSDGVWFDPAAGLFKMWYMGGYTRAVSYATSRDGITWDKPTLDVVPGTNIVYKKFRDSDTVWFDANEANPAHRYKMLLVTQCRDGRDGVEMEIRYSADGIHWATPAVQRWAPGDRTTFFYNPFRRKWVLSIRHDDKQVGRARMYAESDDLADAVRRMDELGRLWTCADKLDPHNPDPAIKNAEPQLYALDAVAYESLVVGLFSIWQGDPDKRFDKRNELLVGYSRDGFHWQRPCREPFAGVNQTDGAWNWGNVQSAGGVCTVVGDELRFYTSGRGKTRATEAAVTGLAVLRRDGFASMEAGADGGALTTRPLTFKGRYLFVNADARGGELRVEVLDRDGAVIDAFRKEACEPMIADSTIHPVRWKPAADLGALADKPVRLRFHLKQAKLYSFWVSPDESGASHGYVAAGGPGYTEPRDTVGMAAYRAAAACRDASAPTTRPTDGGKP